MMAQVDDSGLWVLYVLEPSAKIIHVLDPHYSCEGAGKLEEMHGEVARKIVAGFSECARAFYDGWVVDPNAWEYVYLEGLDSRICRYVVCVMIDYLKR
jgi:hypothetical protein